MVTGGSRGIGRAVCVSLAEAGYPLIINYRSNHKEAEITKKLVKSKGVAAELLPFDVSDEKSVVEALDFWTSSHPDDYVAVLVNNAGIRKDNLMVFMEDEDWNDVLQTNLNSFFYITRYVVKYMMTKRWGRVVNVASLSGLKGLSGQVNYSAAKAGLIGATKALAQEVASRKVTVNAVAPGFILTDMTAELPEDELRKQIPMGRFGKAVEVAAVVAFLASEAASYVTGEVISVNGGLYS